MFEKVNPCHPDKVADRIAGALVDLAYKKAENPRIAIEVLIGHGVCHIIVETSVILDKADVTAAVHRIAGNLAVDYVESALAGRSPRQQPGICRAPADRGFMLQDGALFPWLSIYDNIAFGLRAGRRSTSRKGPRRRIYRWSASGASSIRIRTTFGGMCQRASLARALVGKPKVLDEPLGALG